MANLFDNLPVTAGDGSGAGVDTSAYGRERTITVQDTFTGSVTIEISNEAIGGPYLPLITLTNPGKRTIPIAAQFMRVTRSGVDVANPGLPNVDVASNDDGGLFADLPATAGDGSGAAINVSTFGTFNTVIVNGPFAGSVNIEISEDNVNWTSIKTFTTPGIWSKVFTAQFMRATRSGVTGGTPGLPNIDVGAVNDPASSAIAGDVVSTCYVYRPGGGGVGPAVFDSWADLMTALTAARVAAGGEGCWRVRVDDTATSPAVIPAGAWDMSDVTLEGGEGLAANAGLTRVSVADGAVFTNLRSFAGLMSISHDGVVSPVDDIVAGSHVTIDGTIILASSGPATFFDLTNVLAAERAFFFIRGAVVLGDNVNATINQPTALSAVTFLMGPGATIAHDALSAQATATQRFIMNSNSATVDDQPTSPAVVTMDPELALRWNPVLVPALSITAVEMGDVALCDPSGGANGVTLPAVTEYNAGQCVMVKNVSGSILPISITPDGAQTIDGVAAPFVSTTQRACYVLVAYTVGGTGAWAVVPSYNVTNLRYGTATLDKPVTLTDVPAGVVSINPSESDYFFLAGAGATTRELGAPTPAPAAGERRTIVIEYQHAGDAALTFNAVWLFGSPGAPTYPSAVDGSDIITAVWNGTNWLASYVQEYA